MRTAPAAKALSWGSDQPRRLSGRLARAVRVACWDGYRGRLPGAAQELGETREIGVGIGKIRADVAGFGDVQRLGAGSIGGGEAPAVLGWDENVLLAVDDEEWDAALDEAGDAGDGADVVTVLADKGLSGENDAGSKEAGEAAGFGDLAGEEVAKVGVGAVSHNGTDAWVVGGVEEDGGGAHGEADEGDAIGGAEEGLALEEVDGAAEVADLLSAEGEATTGGAAVAA